MSKWPKLLALTLCLMMLAPCALALATDDIRDDLPTPAPSVEPTPEHTLSVPGVDPVEPTYAMSSTTPKLKDLGAGLGTGEGMAEDITKKCKSFKLSEGKAQPMLDNKLKTYWTNKKNNAKFQFTLPATHVPGGLYIEWIKKPGDFSIVQYDKSGAVLATTGRTDSYTGLVNFYPLDEATAKVEMKFPKKGAQIAKLTVYSQGELPSGVQNFVAAPEKVDLLVIAAHQGDEFLYFGGTVPYYTSVEGKVVQVVYMANGGRQRYKEALTGLWAVGQTYYPEFLGFSNKAAKDLKQASKLWNAGKTREKLVEMIRKYRPEVIVTHDVNGENKSGANMLTATVIQDAVTEANESTKFPASATKYGTWQTKKLYLHLYNENQITMDWQTAQTALDGLSPSAVAKQGYLAHASLKKVKYADGGAYDNAKFGLAFTAVGVDELKNDMFENITDSAADYDPNLSLYSDGEGGYEQDNVPGDATINPEDYLDEADKVDYSDMDETDMSDVLDGNAGVQTTPPPVSQEGTEQGANWPLISLLAGVPVLVGGGAYGYSAYRKYDKRRRKAKRRLERQYKSNDTEAV